VGVVANRGAVPTAPELALLPPRRADAPALTSAASRSGSNRVAKFFAFLATGWDGWIPPPSPPVMMSPTCEPLVAAAMVRSTIWDGCPTPWNYAALQRTRCPGGRHAGVQPWLTTRPAPYYVAWSRARLYTLWTSAIHRTIAMALLGQVAGNAKNFVTRERRPAVAPQLRKTRGSSENVTSRPSRTCGSVGYHGGTDSSEGTTSRNPY
jgi:hypothetical protein